MTIYYSDFATFPNLANKFQATIKNQTIKIIYIGRTFYKVKGNQKNLESLYK